MQIAPRAQTAFGRELDHYVAWYNAERPHSRFGARTPDEMYFGRFPACRRPRRSGAVVELHVTYHAGRKHLPVVSLKRVA